MEEMTKFVLELYEIGFISSILFVLFIIFDFGIKFYGRVKVGKNTKFVLTNTGKIIFLLAIALIMSYLI